MDNKKDTKKEKKNQAPQEEEHKEQNLNLKEIEEMYRAGIHFGYSRSLRHPRMRPYFFGNRNGVYVFNLEKVYLLLKRAMAFMEELGKKKAKILFVATKPEASDTIEKTARELDMPFVAESWLGGLLTNFDVIKKRIEFFKKLKEKKTADDFSGMSKKEKARLEKKLAKMEERFSGLTTLTEIPQALLVVDSIKEAIAVKEAKRLGIPIVAILNSDCDPTAVDYPIPANDAAVSSIEYLVAKLAEAYKKGKGVQQEKGLNSK